MYAPRGWNCHARGELPCTAGRGPVTRVIPPVGRRSSPCARGENLKMPQLKHFHSVLPMRAGRKPGWSGSGSMTMKPFVAGDARRWSGSRLTEAGVSIYEHRGERGRQRRTLAFSSIPERLQAWRWSSSGGLAKGWPRVYRIPGVDGGGGPGVDYRRTRKTGRRLTPTVRFSFTPRTWRGRTIPPSRTRGRSQRPVFLVRRTPRSM